MCAEEGLGVIVYNPLAGGFLTGKYRRGETPPRGTRLGDMTGYQGRYLTEQALELVDAFLDAACARGVTPAQLALAWVLGRPGITSTILGASRAEQLRETLPAVEVKLTAEELAFCDQIWHSLPRSPNPADPTR